MCGGCNLVKEQMWNYRITIKPKTPTLEERMSNLSEKTSLSEFASVLSEYEKGDKKK